MASLVEQIYMQAQGGSAGGAGFADFLVQGRQVNQRQQQIELQKQQVAAELAQLPLKQTLLQQDAQMNALKIQDVLEQRQFAIEDEKTVSTAWEWVSRDLKDKNPAGALTTWMDFAGQLPRLTQNPKFLQLRKDIETSLNIATELARIRPQGPTYQPGFGVAVNPLTGKQEAYFQTGAGSAQLVDSTAETFKPQTMTVTDPVTGKPISLIQTGKNTWREPRGEGESFEFTTPTGETMKVTRGGAASKAGGLPASVVSNAEEKITGAVNAVRLGGALVNKLRPEDLGVLGKGGEIIVDESLAQMFPGLANKQRIDSRTLLRLFINDFTMALKDPGTMSNQDRQRIEAMLPSLDAKESLPDAIQKIKSATKEAATRSRFAAERAGRPLPNELLKPAELLEKVKRGEITVQQATELAKNSPFRDEYDDLLPK